MALTLLLVVAGVVCLVVGAAMVYPAAGVLMAGVLALGAAYVVRYVKVRSR